MTIKEMRFPQGLRYGTLKEAQKINLDEYIYQHAKEAEFLEFSPGVYDLTPDEVANVLYRYILQVNPSGTGMIFFIPNEPGVVLVDPKMPDEEFITHQQVLGPNSKPMVIISNRDKIEPRDEQNPVAYIFAVVYWSLGAYKENQ